MSPLWQTMLTRYGPLLLAGIALLLLASDLAKLTWLALLPQDDSDTLLIEPAAAVTQPPGTPAVQKSIAREVVAKHLFGEVQVEQPKPVQTSEAPETRLNLTLRGVVATGGPDGAAIIADGSGRDQLYRVGGEIQGGTRLKEVHADRVILERSGRFETLRLPKARLEGVDTNTRLGVDPSIAASQAAGQGGEDVNAILRGYRDDLLNDPQRVMGLMQAAPAMDNGRQIGYRITHGRDKRVLPRFGLQSGDVVTSVNGVTLDSPIKGLEVINGLASADQLQLQILRDGQLTTLIYQLGEE